jgi:DNA-binding NtrC family response regulator
MIQERPTPPYAFTDWWRPELFLGAFVNHELFKPANSEAVCVYAVDDNEDLTNLYATLLQNAGYFVLPFNDRVDALAALEMDLHKPRLLITDFRGHAMAAKQFVQRCVALQPTLRVLMASGFHHDATDLACIRADWFIRKPFTPEEFLEKIRTALVDS